MRVRSCDLCAALQEKSRLERQLQLMFQMVGGFKRPESVPPAPSVQQQPLNPRHQERLALTFEGNTIERSFEALEKEEMKAKKARSVEVR